MITSVKNPKIQWIRSLLDKRQDREREHAYVVEGVRLVEEAVGSGIPIRLALYTTSLSSRGMASVAAMQTMGVDVEEVMPHVLSAVTGTETPQGVLAVMELAGLPLPALVDFALVLDTIRDPGNLGTLLRSAAAAGVQAVLISPETADVYSPKVVRSAMGAHFHLPIVSTDWQTIRNLLGIWKVKTWLTDADASMSMYTVDFRIPSALVISGEATGISEGARALAQGVVSIPMPGRAESLNAAIAGSILLFEVVRQRTI